MRKLQKKTPQLRRIAIVGALVLFYSAVIGMSVKNPDTSEASNFIQQSIDKAMNDPSGPKDTGALRAQIALAEYNKGVREKERGCNCGAEVDIYTLGLQKQWCAMFVSWVFNQAGTPFTKDSAESSWRIEQARDVASWLEANGTWYSREQVIRDDLRPQIGDVVIYWRGDYEGDLGHVDIVVATDPAKPGSATLVGGNLDDAIEIRENYLYEQHYGFLGFGRP